ncbi:MAG: hypothetical protein NTY29_10055 [Proteobacteria bacterium]|nr:hypothetical protein [Pseudomonadota bacterium]
MKHKSTMAVIVLIAFLYLLCAADSASCRILLFDGALELSGYAREYYLIRTHIPRQEQQFHKSNMDMSLSSFLVEGLCRITDRYDPGTKRHRYLMQNSGMASPRRCAVPMHIRRMPNTSRKRIWISAAAPCGH